MASKATKVKKTTNSSPSGNEPPLPYLLGEATKLFNGITGDDKPMLRINLYEKYIHRQEEEDVNLSGLLGGDHDAQVMAYLIVYLFRREDKPYVLPGLLDALYVLKDRSDYKDLLKSLKESNCMTKLKESPARLPIQMRYTDIGENSFYNKLNHAITELKEGSKKMYTNILYGILCLAEVYRNVERKVGVSKLKGSIRFKALLKYMANNAFIHYKSIRVNRSGNYENNAKTSECEFETLHAYYNETMATIPASKRSKMGEGTGAKKTRERGEEDEDTSKRKKEKRLEAIVPNKEDIIASLSSNELRHLAKLNEIKEKTRDVGYFYKVAENVRVHYNNNLIAANQLQDGGKFVKEIVNARIIGEDLSKRDDEESGDIHTRNMRIEKKFTIGKRDIGGLINYINMIVIEFLRMNKEVTKYAFIPDGIALALLWKLSVIDSNSDFDTMSKRFNEEMAKVIENYLLVLSAGGVIFPSSYLVNRRRHVKEYVFPMIQHLKTFINECGKNIGSNYVWENSKFLPVMIDMITKYFEFCDMNGFVDLGFEGDDEDEEKVVNEQKRKICEAKQHKCMILYARTNVKLGFQEMYYPKTGEGAVLYYRINNPDMILYASIFSPFCLYPGTSERDENLISLRKLYMNGIYPTVFGEFNFNEKPDSQKMIILKKLVVVDDKVKTVTSTANDAEVKEINDPSTQIQYRYINLKDILGFDEGRTIEIPPDTENKMLDPIVDETFKNAPLYVNNRILYRIAPLQINDASAASSAATPSPDSGFYKMSAQMIKFLRTRKASATLDKMEPDNALAEKAISACENLIGKFQDDTVEVKNMPSTIVNILRFYVEHIEILHGTENLNSIYAPFSYYIAKSITRHFRVKSNLKTDDEDDSDDDDSDDDVKDAVTDAELGLTGNFEDQTISKKNDNDDVEEAETRFKGEGIIDLRKGVDNDVESLSDLDVYEYQDLADDDDDGEDKLEIDIKEEPLDSSSIESFDDEEVVEVDSPKEFKSRDIVKEEKSASASTTIYKKEKVEMRIGASSSAKESLNQAKTKGLSEEEQNEFALIEYVSMLHVFFTIKRMLAELNRINESAFAYEVSVIRDGIVILDNFHKEILSNKMRKSGIQPRTWIDNVKSLKSSVDALDQSIVASAEVFLGNITVNGTEETEKLKNDVKKIIKEMLTDSKTHSLKIFEDNRKDIIQFTRIENLGDLIEDIGKKLVIRAKQSNLFLDTDGEYDYSFEFDPMRGRSIGFMSKLWDDDLSDFVLSLVKTYMEDYVMKRMTEMKRETLHKDVKNDNLKRLSKTTMVDFIGETKKLLTNMAKVISAALDTFEKGHSKFIDPAIELIKVKNPGEIEKLEEFKVNDVADALYEISDYYVWLSKLRGVREFKYVFRNNIRFAVWHLIWPYIERTNTLGKLLKGLSISSGVDIKSEECFVSRLSYMRGFRSNKIDILAIKREMEVKDTKLSNTAVENDLHKLIYNRFGRRVLDEIIDNVYVDFKVAKKYLCKAYTVVKDDEDDSEWKLSYWIDVTLGLENQLNFTEKDAGKIYEHIKKFRIALNRNGVRITKLHENTSGYFTQKLREYREIYGYELPVLKDTELRRIFNLIFGDDGKIKAMTDNIQFDKFGDDYAEDDISESSERVGYVNKKGKNNLEDIEEEWDEYQSGENRDDNEKGEEEEEEEEEEEDSDDDDSDVVSDDFDSEDDEEMELDGIDKEELAGLQKDAGIEIDKVASAPKRLTKEEKRRRSVENQTKHDKAILDMAKQEAELAKKKEQEQIESKFDTVERILGELVKRKDDNVRTFRLLRREYLLFIYDWALAYASDFRQVELMEIERLEGLIDMYSGDFVEHIDKLLNCETVNIDRIDLYIDWVRRVLNCGCAEYFGAVKLKHEKSALFIGKLYTIFIEQGHILPMIRFIQGIDQDVDNLLKSIRLSKMPKGKRNLITDINATKGDIAQIKTILSKKVKGEHDLLFDVQLANDKEYINEYIDSVMDDDHKRLMSYENKYNIMEVFIRNNPAKEGKIYERDIQWIETLELTSVANNRRCIRLKNLYTRYSETREKIENDFEHTGENVFKNMEAYKKAMHRLSSITTSMQVIISELLGEMTDNEIEDKMIKTINLFKSGDNTERNILNAYIFFESLSRRSKLNDIDILKFKGLKEQYRLDPSTGERDEYLEARIKKYHRDIEEMKRNKDPRIGTVLSSLQQNKYKDIIDFLKTINKFEEDTIENKKFIYECVKEDLRNMYTGNGPSRIMLLDIYSLDEERVESIIMYEDFIDEEKNVQGTFEARRTIKGILYEQLTRVLKSDRIEYIVLMNTIEQLQRKIDEIGAANYKLLSDFGFFSDNTATSEKGSESSDAQDDTESVLSYDIINEEDFIQLSDEEGEEEPKKGELEFDTVSHGSDFSDGETITILRKKYDEIARQTLVSKGKQETLLDDKERDFVLEEAKKSTWLEVKNKYLDACGRDMILKPSEKDLELVRKKNFVYDIRIRKSKKQFSVPIRELKRTINIFHDADNDKKSWVATTLDKSYGDKYIGREIYKLEDGKKPGIDPAVQRNLWSLLNAKKITGGKRSTFVLASEYEQCCKKVGKNIDYKTLNWDKISEKGFKFTKLMKIRKTKTAKKN